MQELICQCRTFVEQPAHDHSQPLVSSRKIIKKHLEHIRVLHKRDHLTPVEEPELGGSVTKLVREEGRQQEKTKRVKDYEDILEQADYLYGTGETDKLYKLLIQYKDSDNAEFLWRLARTTRDLSQMSKTVAEDKKKLTYEAFEYAKKALEANEACFAAHKWYAICISDVGDYEGVRKKIGNAFIVKDHLLALTYFLKAEDGKEEEDVGNIR
ncbi:RMD1 protein, partial [Polypterus senegalus]